MQIRKELDASQIRLSLAGRLDTVTAPQLQEALTAALAETEQLELDFTELVYISSAGLRVLLLGQKSAQSSGKTLTLTNVCAEVREVLEITGFTGILTIL